MKDHCCPNNSLSPRERVGERGSKRDNSLISYPLILTFSRSTQKAGIKEKGCAVKFRQAVVMTIMS